MVRKRWRIEGRVQGVGYRRSAQREAERLGLAGWVRNTADGAVEVLAEGDEEAVLALRRWCETGPAGAAVAAIREEAAGTEAVPKPFTVRR